MKRPCNDLVPTQEMEDARRSVCAWAFGHYREVEPKPEPAKSEGPAGPIVTQSQKVP